MKDGTEKRFVTRVGLNALVLLNPYTGYRCGYVEVEPDSKYFGKQYDEVGVNVHGGLTFDSTGSNVAEFFPNSKDPFCFGFDCGHYGDKRDDQAMMRLCETEDEKEMVIETNSHIIFLGGEIRTLEYVIEECEKLAKQLKD